MSAAVAFIRGVGGPTALRMPALRDALTAAGLKDVRTLQVAGNVLLDADGRSAAEVATRVRSTVLDSTGHDLPVIVRTRNELRSLAARNPFVGTQEGRWVMTLLLDRAVAPSQPLVVPDGCADESVVDGREVFIRYDAGVSTSPLQSAWFERRLGAVGTARNANTIAKLVALSATA